MAHQSASKSNTLLEVLLDALTAHPRYWVICALVLAGLVFSVFSGVLGGLIFILNRLINWPAWVTVVLGVLLIVGSSVVDRVSALMVHHYSVSFLQSLWQGLMFS